VRHEVINSDLVRNEVFMILLGNKLVIIACMVDVVDPMPIHRLWNR